MTSLRVTGSRVRRSPSGSAPAESCSSKGSIPPRSLWKRLFRANIQLALRAHGKEYPTTFSPWRDSWGASRDYHGNRRRLTLPYCHKKENLVRDLGLEQPYRPNRSPLSRIDIPVPGPSLVDMSGPNPSLGDILDSRPSLVDMLGPEPSLADFPALRPSRCFLLLTT